MLHIHAQSIVCVELTMPKIYHVCNRARRKFLPRRYFMVFQRILRYNVINDVWLQDECTVLYDWKENFSRSLHIWSIRIASYKVIKLWHTFLSLFTIAYILNEKIYIFLFMLRKLDISQVSNCQIFFWYHPLSKNWDRSYFLYAKILKKLLCASF